MSEQSSDGVPWWRNDPWLGGHLFLENRNKNCALLLQYDGMHLAWFPDGSGIRDADADGFELWKRIEAPRDDPSWYVYEYFSTEPNI
jgi:hypothetical protein